MEDPRDLLPAQLAEMMSDCKSRCWLVAEALQYVSTTLKDGNFASSVNESSPNLPTSTWACPLTQVQNAGGGQYITFQ
jgi:hypothetical protein